MSKQILTVDTRQLERLSGALAALPRDVNAVIASSLRSATLEGLRTIVTKYYALDKRRLSQAYRIGRRAVSSADGTSVGFEVAGRRLTPVHFRIQPLRHQEEQPLLEIIRGSPKKSAPRMGADGKLHLPRVLFLRRGGFNVFRATGRRTRKGTMELYAYRTVSVPQMLGHEKVAGEAQESLLSVFDRVLIPRLEQRLDVAADAIVKG